VAKKDCFLISNNQDNSIEIYLSIDAYVDFGKQVLRQQSKLKKFRYIIECLYRGITNPDIYEEYKKKYLGTAAFKLNKGNTNVRIYCKYVQNEDKTQKRITLHKVHSKRRQKLGNIEDGILKAIQKQEYNYGKIDSKTI